LTFQDERGPCRAPGLSSHIASAGSGPLANAFLSQDFPEEEFAPLHQSLPTVSEDEVLADEIAANTSEDMIGSRGLQSTGTTDSRRRTQNVVAVSTADIKKRFSWSDSPVCEGLEPIDKDGKHIPGWRALVEDRIKKGTPLKAAAFTFLDKVCVLGSGTYGVVWRAQDRNTGKLYAVKNIKASVGRGSLVERECDMSNHLRLQPHPCIVGLFAVHCFPEMSFYMIVMELCTGGDLQDKLKEYRKRAADNKQPYVMPELGFKWIGQMFLGLEHLHLNMKALLRDLKPGNVVIGANGISKLTDFGLGRAGTQSTGVWTFGMPAGSPGYIAPECLLQEEYDSRADLYSFGVVAWVVITGGVTSSSTPRPPVAQSKRDFVAQANAWQLLEQCLTQPEANYAMALDEDTKAFVGKLAQRRPDKRPLHSEIRQFPLMQKLSLPEHGAGRDVVDRWLVGCEGTS